MHALSAYLNGAGSQLRGGPVQDLRESLQVLDVLMRGAPLAAQLRRRPTLSQERRTVGIPRKTRIYEGERVSDRDQ